MNGAVDETAVSVQILNLLQIVTQGYELSYALLIMMLHCHCYLFNKFTQNQRQCRKGVGVREKTWRSRN